ncbi:hypothetical protein NLX83_27425 [Allokutzneria sp. A3M-2-11 16]|uniref:hypothetical protein n=1 Tax=Allokutzneria sp. A3M-2-11 16 TaxID=2962043 RepID=UPI0020B85119|nr:hypothetical protein [Allokutzneria sp. A3M-2-11 16]MCP3803011.1 hypothetical protein [Allokutzneria sp. A3M-2-11 16]
MRITRVSLLVGALVAGTVTIGGSAAAAGGCYIRTKQETPVFKASDLTEDYKLRKGAERDSACAAENHEMARNVVYLKGRKHLVSKAHVTIHHRG